MPFVIIWLAGLTLAAKMNFVFDYSAADKRVTRMASVLHVLPWVSAETIVLYGVFRPNSFHYAWRRVLIALFILTPWAYWHSIWVVHSPGWYMSHIIWLWGINFALMCLALYCLAAQALKSRQAKKD